MLKEIAAILKNSKRVLITTHINPDGDGIGSGIALMMALNKINKDKEITARFAIDDVPPSYVEYLEGSILIENFEAVTTRFEFDTVVSLDSATKERIGRVISFVKEETNFINIDHHVSNTRFAKLNYIDDSASSTAEIVYRVAKELGAEIDREIGEPLYAGIINDTGNFSHDNVTAETFRIASELRAAGVNTEFATRNMFNMKSFAALKINGNVLENMRFYEEVNLTFGVVSKAYMESVGGTKGDTEGVVDSLRSYEKCEVALFLREDGNGIYKGSLRSNGPDVNVIAESFGGGGHVKAAGFSSNKSPEEIVEIVISQLKKQK